jgi:hypothetical protein
MMKIGKSDTAIVSGEIVPGIGNFQKARRLVVPREVLIMPVSGMDPITESKVDPPRSASPV